MICTFKNVAVASGVSTPPPTTPHPTPRPGIAYGCGESNKPNQGKAKTNLPKLSKPNQGKGAKSHLPKYVQTTSPSRTFPAGKRLYF